jgi:hypothetical protein
MRIVRLGLFVALALPLAAGCRSSQTPAKVSGRVTYKSESLKGGEIAFHSDQGTYRTSINQDGTYEISDLPAGAQTVTVETESLNPDKKAKIPGGARGAASMNERLAAERKGGFGPPSREEQLARYTKIPAKYAKVDTSDLKITLEKGKQTQNFELKD